MMLIDWQIVNLHLKCSLPMSRYVCVGCVGKGGYWGESHRSLRQRGFWARHDALADPWMKRRSGTESRHWRAPWGKPSSLMMCAACVSACVGNTSITPVTNGLPPPAIEMATNCRTSFFACLHRNKFQSLKKKDK